MTCSSSPKAHDLFILYQHQRFAYLDFELLRALVMLIFSHVFTCYCFSLYGFIRGGSNVGVICSGGLNNMNHGYVA